MNKKRMTASMITAVLMMSLGSSSAVWAEADKNAEGKTEIQVAYCSLILDEDQTRCLNGFKKCIEEMNAESEEYYFPEIIACDCNSQLEKQLADIESCVAAGADILFVQVFDDTSCNAALKAAKEKGVTVLTNIELSDPDAQDIWITADDEALMGQILKDWVREKLEADPELNYKVGVVWPLPTSGVPSFGRTKGVEELAEEMPERISIEASGYGNWNTNDTMTLVEDWLQTYDSLNYICCANDEEARGAINVLKSAGIKDQVMVSGENGGSTAVELCKEGSLDVSIGCKKEVCYAEALRYAVDYHAGKETEHHFVADPDVYFVITPETVDDWVAYMEGYEF